VKYWEIIADNLSKAGWSWGCLSAVNATIFPDSPKPGSPVTPLSRSRATLPQALDQMSRSTSERKSSTRFQSSSFIFVESPLAQLFMLICQPSAHSGVRRSVCRRFEFPKSSQLSSARTTNRFPSPHHGCFVGGRTFSEEAPRIILKGLESSISGWHLSSTGIGARVI
jgi:hypothetical protein